MRREGFRLSTRLRRWTYGSLGALFVTGAGWWALQRWGTTATEFGRTTHPAAPWLMRAHGASAMVFLVVFGYLIPIHSLRAWRAGKNIPAGTGLMTLLGALTATGWLLYYAGSESLREWSSAAHLVLGLALPVVLFVHVVLGIRSRRRHHAHPPR